MSSLSSRVARPLTACCKRLTIPTLQRLERNVQLFSTACKQLSEQKRWTSKDIAPKNILELNKRGIFQDIYPAASIELPKLLTSKKQCFYCGFDPTADSLHIGNFLSIMALLYCQRAGHDVIAVIGTSTAQAGDPSEHSKDRATLSADEINDNADKIARQIRIIADNHAMHIYDNRGRKTLPELKILRNDTWYKKMSSVEFVSKVCRNFRMGPMMDKKYIKDRLGGPNGLILAEFMYQVMQAYDWLHLHQEHNCSFQIGGMDQLGNINAGQQLIKKIHRKEVYGLLTPIVTSPAGEKLGKTAGNAIWLSPKKTSPFEFYQYFFRQPDSQVKQLLQYFTFVDLNSIEEITQNHAKQPGMRQAQRILATQVCKIVHGKSGLDSAERCSRALYGGQIEDLESLSDEEIGLTFNAANISNLTLEPHTTIYDLCKTLKAIPTGGPGEHLIQQGGVRINGKVVDSPNQLLLSGVHVLKNDLTIVTVGKVKHHIVRWRLPRIEHAEDDPVDKDSIDALR